MGYYVNIWTDGKRLSRTIVRDNESAKTACDTVLARMLGLYDYDAMQPVEGWRDQIPDDLKVPFPVSSVAEYGYIVGDTTPDAICNAVYILTYYSSSANKAPVFNIVKYVKNKIKGELK